MLLVNAGLEMGLMTVLWGFSVLRRDASIVDPWWSIGFLLVAVNTVVMTGLTPGKAFLIAMVAIWSVRLWGHLLVRSIGKAEDVRYQAFRTKYGADRYWWISFFQVFVLQGILVIVISGPLQLALSVEGPDDVSVTDWIGCVAFVVGFAFESLGDWQLTKFRRDPLARGKILDTGVWRYTRHPNYFGDAMVWWAFWICTWDLGLESLFTVYAPILMTFLLVRVSGVRMLDAHLAISRPGYAAYMARTSGFIPWLPREK